jgi:hypothetical protein
MESQVVGVGEQFSVTSPDLSSFVAISMVFGECLSEELARFRCHAISAVAIQVRGAHAPSRAVVGASPTTSFS